MAKLLDFFGAFSTFQERADAGLPREGNHSRPDGFERLEIPHAPGCTVSYGFPANQSPFVQMHLPRGWKFENKSSRAVSFAPETGQLLRGTNRAKSVAFEMACAWSWRWFGTLSSEHQCLFENQTGENPPGAKRRRVDV